MRYVLALCLIMFAASRALAVDGQPASSSGIESLGNELLEDLSPKAFDEPAANQLDDAIDDQQLPYGVASRAPRFDDLGEDIGKPSGELSLARVRQGMQQAESLLASNKPAADVDALRQAGDAQTQVVAQLDKLIAELSKQCNCNGQCQSPSESTKPGQRSQKKPGKSGSAAAAGQTAARDSTERLDSTTAEPVDKGDVEAMVKDLWGHLPERSREQMMQSFSEEFLPKYELEIEQYYRRLSDENTAEQPK